MNIITISDTHNQHHLITDKINAVKDIDLIIHCGDFADNKPEGMKFLDWFSKLNIKNKILIPGNHENFIEKEESWWISYCEILEINLLINKSVVINDISFYGSPYSNSPNFHSYSLSELGLEKKWEQIPVDTQVLITHTPAYNILDTITEKIKVGSESLGDKIKELPKLQAHLFGHVHQSNGKITIDNIIRINSAIILHLKETPHLFTIN